MQEKSKYELEVDQFREKFDQYKDKKIAIYGIGRRTATLLDGIQDYNVVGLLDRDENNIGKVISGISVISMQEAEQEADFIIINSDPTNFEIIYKRIQNTTLPVYYANGNKAEITIQNTDYMKNPYWNVTIEDLKEQITEHEIISFDFFDTLVMRTVTSPQDVFRIVEQKLIRRGINIDYMLLRQKAVSTFSDKEPSLLEIYQMMQQLSLQHISDSLRDEMMTLELETEREVLVVRKDMFQVLRATIEERKEVFIISDMYMPESFYYQILRENGILDNQITLLLSWKENAAKKSGNLWKYYASSYISSKKALHIGDNYESDIKQAEKYGIDAFYIMSGMELLKNSSLNGILEKMITLDDSVMLGMIISKLFNSPFANAKNKGYVTIRDSETFGYCVFGPMMAQFFLWMEQQRKANQYDRMLFFGRDGYFLEQNYRRFLLEQKITDVEIKYIPISRRIAYIAGIQTEQDFVEYVKFPYIGSFEKFMFSRFNITADERSEIHNRQEINSAIQCDEILEWLQPYREDIRQEVQQEQIWYQQYLQQMDCDNSNKKDAVIDMGFYGTNQYYYQKIVGKSVDGLYFVAYLEPDNKYLDTCRIQACYNKQDDAKAEKSYVKQKSAFLESYLTAPYGTLRYIDVSGNFICEPDKMNQKNFYIKEQTNTGIMEYVIKYVNILTNNSVKEEYAGFIYNYLLSGNIKVSGNILNGYYFDNDMIGSDQVRLEV